MYVSNWALISMYILPPKYLPRVFGAEMAGSSPGGLGRSGMVSSDGGSVNPFTSTSCVPFTSWVFVGLAALELAVVVGGGESVAETMSTSSLASNSASGSMLEARRFSGEEALSGISAAPPMMARWWADLAKGEEPRRVAGWVLGALE